MAEDLDPIWDKAERDLDAAWSEMHAFLKTGMERTKSEPLPSLEEREQFNAQFLEIQQRCNDVSGAIFERAMAGNPPPH